MAPRKEKNQVGKKITTKIKSKLHSKRGTKPFKKPKTEEKPLDNLKWLNKVPNETEIKKCDNVSDWFSPSAYDVAESPRNPKVDSMRLQNYLSKNKEEKSVSDASDECDCRHSPCPEDKAKAGILKRKYSSSNSLVAKYIKSGMNHVASFIVESAIRFGEQHGVVVPDKKMPNLYEFTPPEKLDEKCRKIRFKIPERVASLENTKKAIWESRKESSKENHLRNKWKKRFEDKTSSEKSEDSLEEILPVLEKLQKEEGIITSDLDLDSLRKTPSVAEESDAGSERKNFKKRFKSRENRYKSPSPVSDKGSDDPEYDKKPWKNLKRDSVELNRQRIRASACPRKAKSPSPSSY